MTRLNLSLLVLAVLAFAQWPNGEDQTQLR